MFEAKSQWPVLQSARIPEDNRSSVWNFLCCVLSLLSNTENSKILEKNLIPGAKKKCFPSLPWLHRLVYMHTDSNRKDKVSFSKLKPEVNWNIFTIEKLLIMWQTMTLFTLKFYHSFRNYIFKDHIKKWANIGYNVDYGVETKVLWLPFVLLNQQCNNLSFDFLCSGFVLYE